MTSSKIATSTMANPSFTVRDPLEPFVALDNTGARDMSSSSLTNALPSVVRQQLLSENEFSPASTHAIGWMKEPKDYSFKMGQALYNMALVQLLKESV